MAADAIDAKLTSVYLGLGMTCAASGVCIDVMLVAVTVCAILIGVSTRQRKLVMLEALDHTVLPIMALCATGPKFFDVGRDAIMIVVRMAGEAVRDF